jgi:hypothetical protein
MATLSNGGRLAALGLLCLATVGCGRSDVASVSGQLTYKGKPVPNVIIHFVPENGRPSQGETDRQGKFVLTYDPQTKGAQIGKHKVWVQPNPIPDPSDKEAVPGMPAKISSDLKGLFDKYSGDKSKVEVTIDKSVSDLKLEWD